MQAVHALKAEIMQGLRGYYYTFQDVLELKVHAQMWTRDNLMFVVEVWPFVCFLFVCNAANRLLCVNRKACY